MITFDELNIPYLPSGRLWRGFAPPTSFSPTGAATISQSGNPAFGMYDNFHSFHATTLEGPYRTATQLATTLAQIADTSTEKGMVQLALATAAADAEASLQWGRGLSTPFQLSGGDLVFEARVSAQTITANVQSWAIGLGAAGTGVADGLLADTGGALADTSFIGFHKLNAAAGSISATYRNSGQAVQNGSTNTRLLNLVTPASNAWVKLGFRYRVVPQTVEWFVNGVLAGTTAAPARLTASQISSTLFPSTALLTPVVAIKATAASAVGTLRLDWWACAQNL